MISSFSAKSGFIKDLIPTKLTFKKGLNILFGPNGCGKTSLLKCLAAYSACHQGGWSMTPISPFEEVNKPSDFLRVFRENTPAHCECRVSWTGTPTYLWMPDHDPAAFACLEITDGIIDSKESIMELMNKPSSGQRIIYRLNKLQASLKERPDLSIMPNTVNTFEGKAKNKNINSLYQNTAHKFFEYIKSIQKQDDQTFTILMDEPTKSLSIPDASLLWEKAFPNLATKCQLIVATHDPFALLNKNAHWISVGTDPDYLKNCKEAVSLLKSC